MGGSFFVHRTFPWVAAWLQVLPQSWCIFAESLGRDLEGPMWWCILQRVKQGWTMVVEGVFFFEPSNSHSWKNLENNKTILAFLGLQPCFVFFGVTAPNLRGAVSEWMSWTRSWNCYLLVASNKSSFHVISHIPSIGSSSDPQFLNPWSGWWGLRILHGGKRGNLPEWRGSGVLAWQSCCQNAKAEAVSANLIQY